MRAVLVTALALSLPAPAAACEIRGTLHGVVLEQDLRRVRVRRPREALATLLRPGYVALRAADPPALEGLLRGALDLRIARPTDVAGAVYLPPGLRVTSARSDGDAIRADIEIAPGVVLRRAPLACEDLSFGREHPPPTHVAREHRGPRWVPRLPIFTLFPSADADGALRFAHASDALDLVELARRGGLVELAGRTSLGVTLRGWARDADLTRP